MQIREVKVERIPNAAGNELSDTCYRICVFCDKVIRIVDNDYDPCIRMAGDQFYCPFCVRNCFHYRTSRNVLIMSYRAILGYYYFKFYNVKSHRIMYYNQLERMIDRHVRIGLQNPVFIYDPSTFLWFVDFNRVGKAPHKASIGDVRGTAINLLSSLEVDKNLSVYVHNNIWDKFSKAIDTFYEKRKRPKDRRMLIPTFHKIINSENDNFYEYTREFVKSFMISK